MLCSGRFESLLLGRLLSLWQPFCELFLRLYHKSQKKHHLVASILPSPFLGLQSSSFDWEAVDVVVLLWFSARPQHVFLGRKDSRFWSFDPSKGFSCKSPFHILSVSHSPRLPQFLPLFGRVKYQRRPNFFEWQDLHGRVNTIDHVQHHSSFMLHLQWCIICRQQEDLHHLLWGGDLEKVVELV